MYYRSHYVQQRLLPEPFEANIKTTKVLLFALQAKTCQQDIYLMEKLDKRVRPWSHLQATQAIQLSGFFCLSQERIFLPVWPGYQGKFFFKKINKHSIEFFYNKFTIAANSHHFYTEMLAKSTEKMVKYSLFFENISINPLPISQLASFLLVEKEIEIRIQSKSFTGEKF